MFALTHNLEHLVVCAVEGVRRGIHGSASDDPLASMFIGERRCLGKFICVGVGREININSPFNLGSDCFSNSLSCGHGSTDQWADIDVASTSAIDAPRGARAPIAVAIAGSSERPPPSEVMPITSGGSRARMASIVPLNSGPDTEIS